MNARSRVISIRIADKIRKYPEFAKEIGVSAETKKVEKQSEDYRRRILCVEKQRTAF